MRINNFKELDNMEEELVDESLTRIKGNVIGSLGLFKFAGNLIELFMPNVVEILINMTKDSEQSNKHTNKSDT